MSGNHVIRSYFSNIVSSTCGGAICNNEKSTLYVYHCTFICTESSDMGGAVYKNQGSFVCKKCSFCKIQDEIERKQ